MTKDEPSFDPLSVVRAQAYNDAAAREDAVYRPLLHDAAMTIRSLERHVRTLASELALAKGKNDVLDALVAIVRGDSPAPRGEGVTMARQSTDGRGAWAAQAPSAPPAWLLALSRGDVDLGGLRVADRIDQATRDLEAYRGECALSLQQCERLAREQSAAPTTVSPLYEPAEDPALGPDENSIEGQDPLPGLAEVSVDRV